MEKAQKFKAPCRGAALALLALALVLPSCGGGDKGELAIEPGSERAERREGQGTGSTDGGSSRLQLTGSRAFDGEFDVGCGVYSDKGLQFTFDRPGTDTPQVVLRIDDYLAAGNYSGTVIVRDHYSEGQDAPQSIGAGQIKVSTARTDGPPAGTLFSGSFTGNYGGALGAGKVSGTFERCFFTYLTR